jgi:hypothetical protein
LVGIARQRGWKQGEVTDETGPGVGDGVCGDGGGDKCGFDRLTAGGFDRLTAGGCDRLTAGGCGGKEAFG